jgi:hypothetical protein
MNTTNSHAKNKDVGNSGRFAKLDHTRRQNTPFAQNVQLTLVVDLTALKTGKT